jgi:hypothetical protein
MKKIIFFVSFLLIWISFSYADTTTITKVTYSWNLTKDTLISIYWNNFEDCDKVKINWEEQKIKDVNKSKITFNFKNNIIDNWTIEIICDTEKYYTDYNFPYISKVSLWQDLLITISWNNFWEFWNAIVKWWSFEKQIWSNTQIVWKLPNTINSN